MPSGGVKEDPSLGARTASEPNLAVFDLELNINNIKADREQALSSTKRNCSMKLPLTTACTNAAVIYVFNISTDQDPQSSTSRGDWTSSNAAYGCDLALVECARQPTRKVENIL